MDFGLGDMGGGDFLSKITQLASQWNPFPMLQQLDSSSFPMGGPGPGSGLTPGAWDWMNPAGVGGPTDPTKVQSGPLAGVPASAPPPVLPTPPAAKPGASPLSTQQMALLNGMMPKPPEPKFAPAVAPQSGGRMVQMAPMPATPGVVPRMSLAEILGRAR